jgi:hypothetical protein
MDEFEQRCEKAIEELRKLKKQYQEDGLAFQSSRINGKIEGVQLSLSYYREEKVMEEHAFDKKEEQFYDNLRKAVINYAEDNNGLQDGDGIK